MARIIEKEDGTTVVETGSGVAVLSPDEDSHRNDLVREIRHLIIGGSLPGEHLIEEIGDEIPEEYENIEVPEKYKDKVE